jgi:hypothetical protein
MDAETKSQIKGIWDDFWAGGLSNPLAVMEQIIPALIKWFVSRIYGRRLAPVVLRAHDTRLFR